MQDTVDQKQAGETPADNVTIFEDEGGKELAWVPGIAHVQFGDGSKVKITTNGQTLDCKFVEQRYEAIHTRGPRLRVIVKHTPTSKFDELDSDTQDFIRFGIAFCILLVIGTVASTIYTFVNYPTKSWGFVGYHLRWFGFVAIGVVGFSILLTTKGYATEEKTFAGQALGLIYSAILLLMLAGWWFATSPAKPLASYPNDYAEYAKSLWKLLDDKSATLVIAAGWLAGVFKLVGWTNWSAAAENLGDLWKWVKGDAPGKG